MAELSTEYLPTTVSVWEYEYELNETECELSVPPATMGLMGLALFGCLLGLVENGIIMWFLSFLMKRNPFTVYILNLAVADSVFCLCSAAFLIGSFVGYLACDSSTFVYMIFLFTVLSMWLYSISLYLLTAISTERCVSILYPNCYQSRRPKHLSAIMSALLWALSSTLSCYIGVYCQDLAYETSLGFLHKAFVLNVLIVSPIMVLSSLILFIKVQRSSQQCPPSRLYAAILLTVIFFLLLTLPQSILFFLNSLDKFKSTVIFCGLACSSCVINPCIYFVVGSCGKRQFCGSFKLAVQRVFEEPTDSRKDRDPPPNTDPVESVI